MASKKKKPQPVAEPAPKPRPGVWERANNIAFIVLMATIVGFGIYAVTNLAVRFGAAEAMNQIGFVALTTVSLAVIWEGIRAVRARGVPERWWVSITVALAVPLFLLGAVAAATPPVGAWAFYAVALVMSSIVFQKLYAHLGHRS